MNNDQGYVVGNNGTVLYTTDGGGNWIESTSGTTASLYGIHFWNPDTGMAVGTEGTIIFTGNGGLVDVREEDVQTPLVFSLEQNYPNPFNPSTEIEFTISEYSDVRLSVFDLLGREIAVLVNERLTPGSYRQSFDGGNLATGVYIYQLRMGSMVRTKSLILLK
jgi:hypothetical protein